MDSEGHKALPGERGRGRAKAAAGPNACGCHCSCSACVRSSPCLRSLKRKLDERDVEVCGWDGFDAGVARVEIESEAVALREVLVSHQQSVQKLQAELEEERSAAASSAIEAMSMILRLQREKAEAVLEARQFKRLAEGKMAQNQLEIAALEDLLFNHDQIVQALSWEVQAYRHRLLSYGVDVGGYLAPIEPGTLDAATGTCSIPHFDLSPDYPPLRCAGDDATNHDRYPSEATAPERIRSSSSYGVMDKGVVLGQSPTKMHLSYSYGNYCSDIEFNKGEQFQPTSECASECCRRDVASDRVYTVDAVHGSSTDNPSMPKGHQNMKDVAGMQRELRNRKDVVGGVEDMEIRKLCMRLQALDADRESMKQTLLSMSTDKAQMVLLKEIAERMCKKGAPDKRIVNKPSSVKRFSFMSMIKSVFSFFWRKKSCRVRYTFGLCPGNVGLLLLLEKVPYTRHRRFLTRAQG